MTAQPAFQPQPPAHSATQTASLLETLADTLHKGEYSPRTEEAYLGWAKRFMSFHNDRPPERMGATEVEAFLNDLAARENISASTRNQAAAALRFVYKNVLGVKLSWPDEIGRVERSKHLPTVLTVREVAAVLDRTEGVGGLVARLLYGTGMRLLEGLSLRVKDLDFDLLQATVRDSAGAKERETILPATLAGPLKAHLVEVKALHEQDLRAGIGVVLPEALAAKYPNMRKDWGWQFVFPAKVFSTDPATGMQLRHHIQEQVAQRAIRRAARESGIGKTVSPQILRHCFAAHLLEAGYDIHRVQELMGHKDLATTKVYARVLKQDGEAMVSPLDRL